MKKLAPHRVVVQLGLKVVEARNAKGLTQEALAERMGLSPRQLQRIEAGSSDLTVTKLVEIANALDQEPAALLAAPTRPSQRRPGRPRSKARKQT